LIGWYHTVLNHHHHRVGFGARPTNHELLIHSIGLLFVSR
jgi:hypothetical protein